MFLPNMKFRVEVHDNFKLIKIPANQTYKPIDCRVPGDFSSAAFLLAAAAITNSKVQINNLEYRSVQGDKAILGHSSSKWVLMEKYAITALR